MIARPKDRDRRDSELVALVDAAVRHQSELEAFVDLHTVGAVIVNIAGRRVLGRSELGAAMRAALHSPLANVTTTVEVDDIRYVRPDVAIVSCTKQVHDARDGAHGALPSAGALTYVAERSGGRWRIALAQTTPVSA